MAYDVSDCFDLIVEKMLDIQKELGETGAQLSALQSANHMMQGQLRQKDREIEALRKRIHELQPIDPGVLTPL